MASKICVPCDFGIANMYDPFHGNVNIEFNEASNANNSLKNGNLIEIFVGRFSKIENIATIFVERYLNETFTSIASETLDHLLLICSKDFVPVLKSLKQHLIEGEIDDTTRSLLSNFKIVEYLAGNLDIYEDVCELLANKSGNMIGDDFKMLTNLNLCVIRATRGIIKTFSKQVVPVQDIPNLFHNGEMFYNLSTVEVIKRLTSIPNISMFMMVELLAFWVNGNYNLLQSMTQIFTSKLLCRVPRIFVQSFSETDCLNVGLAHLPQSFVSEDDTAVIVCEETTEKYLVTTTNYYKFYFQHPAIPQCENRTECGFMLKVTPGSKFTVGKFNIQLVTKESEYLADIHCHSEVISAAHMHLVMEEYWNHRWYNKEDIKRWYHMRISWEGKPEYNKESGGVEWGDVVCDNSRARLVVYYDIRDKM